jgi:hypothetical protein
VFKRNHFHHGLLGQLIGNRLLDNGTLEEARVVACVQHGGIGERELAKIVFGDEPEEIASTVDGDQSVWTCFRPSVTGGIGVVFTFDLGARVRPFFRRLLVDVQSRKF